jgi:hypothetical protein
MIIISLYFLFKVLFYDLWNFVIVGGGNSGNIKQIINVNYIK